MYTFRFSLFDVGEPGAGVELWRESARYSVPSSKTITHILGGIVPFSEGRRSFDPLADASPVDFTRQLWVEVAAGTSFSKRVKLTAVPFAIATSGLRVIPNETSPNLIGGHAENEVSGGVYGATIAGGGEHDHLNRVSAAFGTVGGGRNNLAGEFGTVAGGMDNQATGIESSVSGGATNTASGDGASIGGGCSNVAAGYRAFAAGEDANASLRGMFVWSASDNRDTNDGLDNHFRRVFEYDGFPQTTDGTSPNTLLKPMQFWVKAPGGVFFVTGRDDNGAPLGVMLPMGGQSWEPITTSPVLGSLKDAAPDAAWTAGDRHAPVALRTLQEQVLDLERRSTAQRDELAESRAENAALRAQLENLALRLAELRQLMAGVPWLDGNFAALKTGGAPRP